MIKPEKPQVRYATDAFPGGDRFVRTVGLASVGQTEIGALVQAKRDHHWDHCVVGVLDFLANYVIGSRARILPEETVEYGWTFFRMRERTPAVLECYEIADVFSNEPQPPVVPGVDRAVRLTKAADDVMRRNGLPGVGDFPCRGRGAISCIHLSADPSRPFFMDRGALHNLGDSGWSISCGEMLEQHEEADLVIEHLAHLAARRPFIIPYLTLPIGCTVAFDTEGALVFTPGQKEGHRDPGKPYEFGPWSVIE
jgi:hypothetical protein